MKFRVKIQNSTQKPLLISLEESSCKLSFLKEEVFKCLLEKFGAPDQYILSLNGKDELNGSDDQDVRDLGLVSGDIIRVIFNNKVQEQLEEKSIKQEVVSDMADRDSDRKDVNNESEKSSKDSENPEAQMMNMGESSVENLPVDYTLLNRYLKEPMLCCESSRNAIPETLYSAYVTAMPISKLETMVIVLHVMCTEVGFHLVNEDGEKRSSLILSDCKLNTGVYRLCYIHPTCGSQICLISCIELGSKIVVTGNVKNSTNKTSSSSTFKIDDFIIESPVFSADPLTIYRSLPKLSCQFKDAVLAPVLLNCQNESGWKIECPFLELPNECQLTILKYLDFKSLCTTSRICQGMNELSNAKILWKKLFFKDFPYEACLLVSTSCDMDTDWKLRYKCSYQNKINQQRLRESFSKEILRHRSSFISLPPIIPFPAIGGRGIIGGDFDWLPYAGYIERREPFDIARPREDLIGPIRLLPNRPRLGRNPFGAPFVFRENPGNFFL